MKNEEIVVYKDSFITRIRKFFRKLFVRRINQYNNIKKISNENINESVDDEKRDKFITELIVDDNEMNKVLKKDKFLKEIEGNVEKLNMLSIDRLKKLEKYYDNVITENEKKIKKIKVTA